MACHPFAHVIRYPEAVYSEGNYCEQHPEDPFAEYLSAFSGEFQALSVYAHMLHIVIDGICDRPRRGNSQGKGDDKKACERCAQQSEDRAGPG